VHEVIEVIPSAWERAQQGLRETRAGEGIPLDRCESDTQERVITGEARSEQAGRTDERQ
jgi:hypothetical protein